MSTANPFGLPIAGEHIRDERQCPRCSYALKGLKTGDRCPECGTPIQRHRRGFSGDSFNEVSMHYVGSLSTGGSLLLAALPVLIAGLVASLALGLASSFVHAAIACSVVGATLWSAGVWLTHVDRPGAMAPIPAGAPAGTEARPESWRWRWLNRISQSGWLLGVLCAWAWVQMFNRTPPALVGARLFQQLTFTCLAVGLLGLLPTLFYLASLAEWMYDDVAARKLRLGPFAALFGGIPIGILALSLLGALVTWGIGPITLASFGVVLGAFGLCMWPLASGLLSFGNTCRWARTNRDQSLASDRRRSARILKRIEDGQRPRGGGTV